MYGTVSGGPVTHPTDAGGASFVSRSSCSLRRTVEALPDVDVLEWMEREIGLRKKDGVGESGPRCAVLGPGLGRC